ncbi:hypothetical protein [Stieleria varia]|uniref:Uncharacterized protein n=1 Tax=Stieleria varia TaxID=2528005 RepID=A0A5C6AR87_9BACT|nr:hypothetical protein [Stieleria varia]TWU02240.1 hypothetical protein Pla52n_32900 [Stieleria varia]
MIQFIKNLKEKWNNWCGDRDMELVIRQQITARGFYGKTAQLRQVRLVAVQRPGWIQVFRFEATARVATDDNDGPDTTPEYRELLGLVREDMRQDSSIVELFENEDDRREQFANWSDGLICLRGAHGLSRI